MHHSANLPCNDERHAKIGVSSTTSASFLRYAAMALAALLGTGHGKNARAQTMPDLTTVRLKYTDYRDFQSPHEDRMHIKSPMIWVDTPLSETLELEASAALDSVSGASPLYLDSLSGASGEGIHDRRKAADCKFTKYFENFSAGVGGGWSNEDDYQSKAALLAASFWNDDKTTTYSIGASTAWDTISSVDDPDLSEFRRTMSFLLGVTQVVDRLSMAQSNLTYASGDGYYTDPYKLFDSRPRSREEWAWLTRYVRYIESTEGSAHLDYRLFGSSWGTISHMLALSYYQPFGKRIIIRPEIRYYIQNAANFYSATVPPENPESFTSSDQRLSGFGSISAGMKVIFLLSESFEIDVLYDYIRQGNRLYPTSGDDHVRDLGAHYVEVGLTARF